MNSSIFLLGDISLNNGYIRLAERGIDPFYSVKSLFRSSDLVIGNLECLLSSPKGENHKKKPRLKTETSALKLLRKLQIDHVALAHNHIADNLEDGVDRTLQFLSSNGIGAFGVKINDFQDNYNCCTITFEDKKIAILNYVTDDTYPSLPDDFRYEVSKFNLEDINTRINLIRDKYDLIIAYLHWGGRVEGGRYPDWGQNKIAYSIIDAGADIIIGHHPHVIQPMEIYKSKHIYYSLGNFCFDDVLSDGEIHPLTNDRKIGMIVEIKLAESEFKCSEVFIRNEGLLVQPFPEFSSKFKRRNLYYRLFLKCNRILWESYYLKLKLIDPITFFISREDIPFKVKFLRLMKSLFKRIRTSTRWKKYSS